MRIRTWYNTTTNKYYTDYNQFLTDYDTGYINNRGHILISNVYFYKGRLFFDRGAQEKYINRISAKNRVKKKLMDFINKL